jgi:putative peptidoglycan lipid II flippase
LFLVVPCAVAFLAFGDIIAAGIYQSGKFDRDHVVWTWSVLAGAALGLTANASIRLYRAAWYALHDTVRPFRIALVRIALTLVMGYIAALLLPAALGIDERWGVAGLTLASGFAARVERFLLRRSLDARIGPSSVPMTYKATLWFVAIAAAVPSGGLRLLLGTTHPVLLALLTIPIYAAAYAALSSAIGIAEYHVVAGQLSRALRRFRPAAKTVT